MISIEKIKHMKVTEVIEVGEIEIAGIEAEIDIEIGIEIIEIETEIETEVEIMKEIIIDVVEIEEIVVVEVVVVEDKDKDHKIVKCIEIEMVIEIVKEMVI